MRWMFICLAVVCLGACSGNEVSQGPDEFSVVPTLPLEQPESYSVLPSPTPGSDNLADSKPNAEAAAALGGRLNTSGIPQSDAAVVTFASRYGVDTNIRADLFQADEDLRRSRGRLRYLGVGLGRDRYFAAYAPQTLDAYAEIDRFRSAGVNVPSAPPRN
ncbi:MAG: DUF3035 domain-containing protein [Pseudomonadota bacterium]